MMSVPTKPQRRGLLLQVHSGMVNAGAGAARLRRRLHSPLMRQAARGRRLLPCQQLYVLRLPLLLAGCWRLLSEGVCQRCCRQGWLLARTSHSWLRSGHCANCRLNLWQPLDHSSR